MANRGNRRQKTSASKTADALLGYLIPFVIIGLAVADFIRDGEIDKYLIGALLIFGLGALGWRIDVILERYFESRGGGDGGIEQQQQTPP